MRFTVSKLRLFLLATTLFVAVCPRAGAVGSTEGMETPPIANVSGLADSCEVRRGWLRTASLKVLRMEVHSQEELRDPAVVEKATYRQCSLNKAAPMDQREGTPCRKTYEDGIKLILRSDTLMGEACDALKEAGAKSAACKKGEAACFKEASDLLTKSGKKMKEAADLNEQGAKALAQRKAKNRAMANRYREHLLFMATTIRKLAVQNAGTLPKVTDPGLEKVLGTREVEGLPLPMLVGILQIDELKPELFEERARQLAVDIDQSGTRMEKQNRSPWAEQILASDTSSGMITLSETNFKSLSANTAAIDAEAKHLAALSTSYNSVPSAQAQNVPADGGLVRTGSSGTVGAPSTRSSVASASSPSDQPSENLSSASRALGFIPSGGGAPAPSPDSKSAPSVKQVGRNPASLPSTTAASLQEKTK